MNVLVTGGTGFVGRHLIEALVGENTVFALVRNAAKLEKTGLQDRVRIIHGDLFACEPLPEETELVFHLAGLTKAISPSEFTHINFEGTKAFLEKLKGLRRLRKVILVSSLAAAGPSGCDDPLTEETAANPVSRYGRSKWMGENALRDMSPAPFLIIRAPIVFGPGDLDMLDALKLLKMGVLPILGKDQRRYSIIFVKDLVAGMMELAFSSLENEMFYLANPMVVEWEEFMRLVARLMGKQRMHTIHIPLSLGWLLAGMVEMYCRIFRRRAIFNLDKFREMRNPCWVCSPFKAQELVHFTPRFSLEEAMASTINWYRANGFL
jgi:nucleoside-diphosphate-sugar epimerase